MHFLAFKVGSAVSYDCSRLLAREILENVAQMSPFHSPSMSSKVAFLEFYCLLKILFHGLHDYKSFFMVSRGGENYIPDF